MSLQAQVLAQLGSGTVKKAEVLRMHLDSSIRIALEAGIWLLLSLLMALGMGRWFLHQRRMDEADQAARAKWEQEVMEVLGTEPPSESGILDR